MPATNSARPISRAYFSRQSQKTKNTKTDRPRNEHISRDRPKKNKQTKVSKPLERYRTLAFGMALNLCFCFLGLSREICSFRGLGVLVFLVCLGLSRRICSFLAYGPWFFGIVSRNMLISSFGEVPESFVFLWFFGTVSTNMLISWPRSFGIFVFVGTVSGNMIILI